MNIITKSTDIGGKTVSLEVGRFAGQAEAAVLARVGDTMVLSTVVASAVRPDLDYFPLQVEYIERLYAGGRIKGSRWVKREGKASDEAILIARLIDRSIRPLFPKEYKNEVQVLVTVLSVDGQNDPAIAGILATSAALSISSLPWQGPVGALRVGYVPKDGEAIFTANPTAQDLEFSKMDLVVTSTDKAVLMIEAGAQEVPEAVLLQALDFAQTENQKAIKLILDLQKEAGKTKLVIEKEKVSATLVRSIETTAGKKITELVEGLASRMDAQAEIAELKTVLCEKYPEEKKTTISKIIDDLISQKIRRLVLDKNKRVDGRKPDQIRPIEIEVGVLPRTHGSAMFKRGNTQALTVTTLGSPSLEQLIEGMTGEESKRYMHHYYMPPFSVGEVGRLGWPSRREIGHGALAERAIEPVIPSEDKFPYAIRVVSEIMSSNGSTSMASVCGSTLSLMDAGVPITSPVAGIAMGMMSDGKKRVILTDILGLEDFNGDMDFKAAGTKDGLTALQLDVKTLDLTVDLLKEALEQARIGRLFILDKMLAVLAEARTQVSQFAPKIKVVKIPKEKIGEVIGPGGRMIRKIIEETGANIEVEDDGSVNVSAPDESAVDRAVAQIEALTREVQAGEIFEGKVTRLQPFGAFVEILPGKEGLVHVSQISVDYVADPSEKLQLDQVVKVRVAEIDDRGRINLSMLFGEDAQKAAGRPTGTGAGPRRDFRGPRRDFSPRGRSDFSGPPRRDFSSGGRPASSGSSRRDSRFSGSDRPASGWSGDRQSPRDRDFTRRPRRDY